MSTLVTNAAGWPFFWTALAALTCGILAVFVDAQVKFVKKRTAPNGAITTTERTVSFGRTSTPNPSNDPPRIPSGVGAGWQPPR
ncbi:MAG TPA: hypothetical protein VNA20_09150 [Frankiaceae bacterium]|nr:hypothetical protein [Frankiaceae bacterium]